jgi:hypothetical protein
MGRTACREPQCLYSRAIPLLPLWAVRPVQSLSACTVELHLYSPYGPYGLYRAQYLYSRAILLLPLWPVRPVQSLSACTMGCTLPFTLLDCVSPESRARKGKMLYSTPVVLLATLRNTSCNVCVCNLDSILTIIYTL